MRLPPQVNTALTMLEHAGFEAFVVGGAVRDFVRGQGPATDWDIATSARPAQIEAVFAPFRLIETGLKHGTVTVLLDQMPLEITTYRTDGAYSDHRHPDSVRFSTRLEDDLARRDFTMNALAYHPKTGIVDLYGGLDDLSGGLVRCVGDPARRFQEDALRILRALRFASALDMKIEADTAAAIHEFAPLLRAVAAERTQLELTKLLCGAAAGRVLGEFSGVLAVVIPEVRPMFGFDQRNPHHDKTVWAHTLAVLDAAPAEPVLRWAALLHDIGKPSCFSLSSDGVGHFYGHAEKSVALSGVILTRLRFDTARRERILTLIRYHDLPLSAQPKPIKRLLNKLGADAVCQLIALHIADTRGQSAICQDRLAGYGQVEAVLAEILQQQACFSLKDLAVDGNDMLALGLTGKAVGDALQSCLDAVIDEQIANDRAQLIAFVQGGLHG